MSENEKQEMEPTEETAVEEAEVQAPVEEAEVQADDDKEPPVAYDLKEVKDEAGSVKRYCVEIDAENMATKMADILKNLRKSVVVDGFRRGRAPIMLLKSRFGKDAEKEALHDLAMNVADQVVEKDELAFIGEPSLNEGTANEGEPVKLEIDIEVQPKIENLTGHTGGTYTVEVQEVTDEMIDGQIAQIQEGNATYEEVDRPFAKGDGANLDTVVVDKDGVKMDSLCQEDIFMRDPSQNLMPEVFAGLEGKKAGETFSVDVARATSQDEHTDTYTVTVRTVKEKVLPELDDEFAKDLGDFETLDALRKRISDDMNKQADERKRQGAIEQMIDRMISENEFSAPKTIVANQQYEAMMREAQQMKQYGLSLEALGMDPNEYAERSRAGAERLVKAHLLLGTVGLQENLEVTDADVDAEIERRAEEEGRKPLAIRARLEAEKKLDSLRTDLVVTKVEDFLMANNTVEVVAPKPPEEAAPEADKAE